MRQDAPGEAIDCRGENVIRSVEKCDLIHKLSFL